MDDGDDYGIGDTDSIIGDNHSVCSTGSMMTEKPRYLFKYMYICIYVYIYI
jgi:hypothetical protein